MGIYKGVLGTLGTSRTKKVGIDLVTVYSMIEIGDKEIRNVQVSDLTASYLQLALGKEVELLLYSIGPFTKRVLAIKYDAKIRKESLSGPIRGIVASLIFLLISLVLWDLFGWVGAAVVAVVFGLTTLAALKNLIALLRFS